MSQTDLKAVNVRFVDALKGLMPHDKAMELAIGGGFELIGPIEVGLLRHYGLPRDGYLVDVGCGSGRLAKPLSAWLTGRYLGIDLVPALVAHARKIAARPDWRFQVIDHIGIPERDAQADMVCFFSVLTHLTHEQSYWYLEEARRVLKPGGRAVFSFLELREPVHLKIFLDTVEAMKRKVAMPMNTCIDRETIGVWADALGLDVVEIRGGADPVVAEGNLGQSVCVLAKR
ncbi:MAG: class I SAM-dependent methyltransferase [Alphaproteobacteria bacterium]|nr:class I SAM-dependent methyltransferase [Alphaproteobacteria bacterium]MBU1515518.1 class I SAM-dependent methyltransferase [Alphaproteobacteria bacterium]MBU2095516.1 class I SAM-dependent methyltransferase [Alphaproteobacteria bacterium]MBU2150757.1 class I SAM-dependent methyltransferase [Alphaproteobacteria bacterium]MBU2307022.1 class I SAM-dependent methyltransferase [Alphaproteobacteria bacterium]